VQTDDVSNMVAAAFADSDAEIMVLMQSSSSFMTNG
jgi:hypothetical protein